MSEFSIKSSAGTELRLAGVPGKGGAYYRATLVTPVLSGGTEVYDPQLSQVCAFFDELAELWWRGWEGERVYVSPEGQLRISARRDSTGHVSLRADLRDDMHRSESCWGATVMVEAGQLNDVAAGVRGALLEPEAAQQGVEADEA